MSKKRQQTEQTAVIKGKLIHVIIIAILGGLIYANSLLAPLVFDDHYVIVENEELKSDSVFTTFNNPRYIGIVSFALNYRVHQENPFGYHLVNLLIHLCNALLVYWLSLNIFALVSANLHNNNYKHLLCLFIALLFVAHPVQTQAVTYISQRFASLAAFFTFASLLSYIKFRRSNNSSYWLLILSVVCALCAFKTKENTIVIPLVLIVIELLFFRASSVSLKKRILFIVPYFIVLIFVVTSFININQPIENLVSKAFEKSRETQLIPRGQYLLTEFRVIVTYMRLLILPINQSIEYSYSLSQSFFEIKVILSLCAIVLLIGIAIATARKFPVISFGILWYFIFLLVESSVIPISDVIFEHRIYLPSAGFIMAFVAVVYEIFQRLKLRGVTILFIVLVVALSIAAYARNGVWNDRVTLWKDCVDKFPQNWRCHLNLGGAYVTQQKYDDAIVELEIGLKGNPHDKEHLRLLALSYLKTGSLDKATKVINKTMQLDPDFIQFYYQASLDYLNNKKYEAALAILNAAHEAKSSDTVITGMLAHAYCMKGNLDSALQYYDEAAALDSNNPALYHDRGLCLLSNNRLVESRESLLEAINRNAAFADAYFYIAVTYEREKNVEQASRYYELFLSKANPSNPLLPQAQAKLRETGK